jgi:hypothetical protein
MRSIVSRVLEAGAPGMGPDRRSSARVPGACATPPLGAHLTTPRRGYRHHGIYVGDGRVVHYAGLKHLVRRGRVEEVSLQEFCKGRGWQVQHWLAPAYDGPAVVERARSRLGEGRYRLWNNNCEHFAVWCVSGISRSPQAETVKARLAAALVRTVFICIVSLG